MNSNFLNLSAALSALCLLAGVGCSRSQHPVERADVIGFVTLDGEPVEQASVSLSPCSFAGQGTVVGMVSDGLFEFSGTKGPSPGAYEVILRPEEPDEEYVLTQIQERKGRPLKARDSFLKAVQRKGPVIVNVSTDTTNEFEIELTSR